MESSEWDRWNGLMGDADQMKRLKSAQQAECTPLNINSESQCGVFSGSHGTYEATLTSCTCIDFSRRKKPCKHMCRLAIELGIIQVDIEADLTKVKTPQTSGFSFTDAIAKVESLEASAQRAFKDFLYEYLYHKKEHVAFQKDIAIQLVKAEVLLPVKDDLSLLNFYKRDELLSFLDKAGIAPPKRNMSLNNLAVWCMENVPDVPALCGSIETLGLNPKMQKRLRKVYTYLIRKYDKEPYFDPNTGDMIEIPKGAEFVATVGMNGSSLTLAFPDDEVTEQLDRYGWNGCKQ